MLNSHGSQRFMRQIQLVAEVRALLEPALMRMPNVVGVGTGLRRVKGKLTDEVVMTVMVTQKLPSTRLPGRQLIPSAVRIILADREVEVGIDVVETGLHMPNDPHRESHRPVPGGVSIGSYFPALHNGKTGTLGGWVWDRTCKRAVLLSNAHVMALDTANNFPAEPDDPCTTSAAEILQPSPGDIIEWDGDTDAIRIGYLLRWVQFVYETARFEPCETVADAAIALPVDSRDIVAPGILHLGGAVFYTVEPDLGMEVTKCGSATGDTLGVVAVVDVRLRVTYDAGTVCFPHQFQVGKRDPGDPRLADDGDSGSLWVRDEFLPDTEIRPVVGLHFASTDDGSVADATPINTVFQALNLTTLCDGAFRALLDAIFGNAHEADSMEWELRQFRTRMRQSKTGQAIDRMLRRHPDVLFEALVLNPETKRLAVRVAERLLADARSARDIEVKKIDAETVAEVQALLRCLDKARPEASEALKLATKLARQLKGHTIAEVLGLPNPCAPRG